MKDSLRRAAKRAALRTPRLRDVVTERDRLREEVAELRASVERLEAYRAPWLFAPPGHFYSPVPSLDDVRANDARLFDARPRTLPGVDLREAQQLGLLEHFRPFYEAQPFPELQTPGRRYYFENPAYSYSDAIFLHCMIRHAEPRRIIEVGSGFSSAVTLDTNELFFANRIACTFIEPYPEGLLSILLPDDRKRIELLQAGLQDVDLDRFRALEAGDILFIDSTHVAKIGSDVNYLFAEILPSLAPGVFVHVHDIFYPFEYPRPWVYEGRAWNEAYLLRAFLAFNEGFEIVLFNTFLEHFHRPFFEQHMPLCLKNEGGSIWLRRVAASRRFDVASPPAAPPDAPEVLSPDWPEPPPGRTVEERREVVRSNGWWYHRIYLGDGVWTVNEPTPHERVWRGVRRTLPGDLRGASVLDVGCNAGAFSLQLKLRGAGRVVGLEPVEGFRRQAEACRDLWGLDIVYRDLDAHQLDQCEETFDLVVFAGLFYHLKNPLAVVEQIGRLCRDAVVVETEVIPEDPGNRVYARQGRRNDVTLHECHQGLMKFVPGLELNDDPTNWWIPDTTCVLDMLRLAGFAHFSAPWYVEPWRLVLIASKRAESRLDLRALV